MFYKDLKELNKKMNELSEYLHQERKNKSCNNTVYLYAVQGNFPNIGVYTYEYVTNDSYNFCLRQEEGNLCLLPKKVVFANKVDAVLYQNELIMKHIEEENK